MIIHAVSSKVGGEVASTRDPVTQNLYPEVGRLGHTVALFLVLENPSSIPYTLTHSLSVSPQPSQQACPGAVASVCGPGDVSAVSLTSPTPEVSSGPSVALNQFACFLVMELLWFSMYLGYQPLSGKRFLMPAPLPRLPVCGPCALPKPLHLLHSHSSIFSFVACSAHHATPGSIQLPWIWGPTGSPRPNVTATPPPSRGLQCSVVRWGHPVIDPKVFIYRGIRGALKSL